MTTSPNTMIRNISKAPATRADKRPLPPDLTLMIDWPIMAQPAIPPKNPVTKLAIPWPRASLFLLLSVSVMSSTIFAVNKVSSNPTTANANEYGRMIIKVSRLKGTFGSKNAGSVWLMVPKSPTVRISKPE